MHLSVASVASANLTPAVASRYVHAIAHLQHSKHLKRTVEILRSQYTITMWQVHQRNNMQSSHMCTSMSRQDAAVANIILQLGCVQLRQVSRNDCVTKRAMPPPHKTISSRTGRRHPQLKKEIKPATQQPAA